MKGEWQQRPEKMGSFLPKGGLLESRGKQPSPCLEPCRAQSASNYQAHLLCPCLVGRTHAPCSPSHPRFFPLFLPSSLHSLPPSLCLWVGLTLHLCPGPFLLAVSVFSRVPCLPLLPMFLWQELFRVARFPGQKMPPSFNPLPAPPLHLLRFSQGTSLRSP